MESIKRFFTNDNIMLVLVLVNTGIIFISGFLSSQGGVLLFVDSLFTLLFLIEALVKIKEKKSLITGQTGGIDLILYL